LNNSLEQAGAIGPHMKQTDSFHPSTWKK